MDISLIIPTWNNKKLLTATLENLSRCQIPINISWECIVINNNSTDDTENTVLSFKNRLPIRYIFEPLQGVSRAKNAGLKVSTGTLIIFGDDDIEPCKEWLEIYWEAYQKNPAGYYWGGPIESNYEEGQLAAYLVNIAPGSVKGFDLGNIETPIKKNEFFLGANWACPSEIIKQIGFFNVTRGLDPSSGKVKIGEEDDLMERLNNKSYIGLYMPKARVKHFVPLRKMTLVHIANRWEASGLYQADENEQYLKHPLIFGVPRWLMKETFSKMANYFCKRISGRKWHEAYVEYRKTLGTLKRLKQINNQKNKETIDS